MAASGLDWSIGHYESTAERLLPVARVVVANALLKTDERVLDLGCGTGNAAILAASSGARVTGVDPARRLLEVARARAQEQGAKITFRGGEAGAIPVAEGSMDSIMSVFGVIFAADPHAAAAEMSRVATAHGRIVLSAWIPKGTIFEFTSVFGDEVRQALGAPRPPQPFAWHERAALASLLAPQGFGVEVERHTLAFTDTSPAAYLEKESRNHPMAVAGFDALEGLGGPKAQAVRERLLRILEAGNEDPEGFRATSQYVVATCRRNGK